MTFLLGRHAMFGQEPPTYFRSMTAVRLPSLAIVHAANLPAVPLPSTRTSYFSAALTGFISFAQFAQAAGTRRGSQSGFNLRARTPQIHIGMPAYPAPLRESRRRLCPAPCASDCDRRGA